ncbi:hypothetical protein L1987_01746 [Smallanthus sonchifolius]|uniref:Uncharacterized protein n=1 Tax=Smallanthus sonchifolius TaxID=185202 RepID=A0ACB9K638_9ASTR|nr:hypothetical protein L1987_01746 [Smallanthus sonchifolius]
MRVAEAVPATQSRGPVPPQHRAVTTGPENLWTEQLFDHQPTKRMRIAEAVPATQSRGPAWGGPWRTQGWGDAPTGGWGGAHGAASMGDHLRRSQEMQPAWAWGRRFQQPPYGNSSNTYGLPFR